MLCQETRRERIKLLSSPSKQQSKNLAKVFWVQTQKQKKQEKNQQNQRRNRRKRRKRRKNKMTKRMMKGPRQASNKSSVLPLQIL